MVDEKTSEIPVARELFARLELDGITVSLEDLHTQQDTARALVLEHGADYLAGTIFSRASTVPSLASRLQSRSLARSGTLQQNT